MNAFSNKILIETLAILQFIKQKIQNTGSHDQLAETETQLELILQENECMADKLSQTWFDEWNMIQKNVLKKTKLTLVS